MLTCRHCFAMRQELYDCPPKGSTPKGSTPKATCGCAEPICRSCAIEQGVKVQPKANTWDEWIRDNNRAF